MKIIRKHDEFYANENPIGPPKDSFIQVSNLIKNYKKTLEKNISIADVGCATGSFINYLVSSYPQDKIVGYEYLESLIQAGMEFYPQIKIKQASILKRESIPASNFDVVTCLGVLSIFDDIEPAISNLTYMVKPGGKLFIHNMFNPYDIDVFVKYSNSDKYGSFEYESGWNIISQKTITKLLADNGARNIKFHDFNISVELEGDSSDPLRSWTEKLSSGRNQIVNGLHLKQPFYILEADL